MRKAFTADTSAGHTLIVADYGQLELRLLAHMANCRSMIHAFELGGDFHSRCAGGGHRPGEGLPRLVYGRGAWLAGCELHGARGT